MSEEVPMRAGWQVRATEPASNVNPGDLGEIRKTGLHEFHLVYWFRTKSTSFYRGSSLERVP